MMPMADPSSNQPNQPPGDTTIGRDQVNVSNSPGTITGTVGGDVSQNFGTQVTNNFFAGAGRGSVPRRVFLSSTAQDLVAYRQVADDTILRLSQESVVMERFGAQPGTPVAECERMAAECDVVVCIVAHRYGFVPEPGRGSITRREVEAARAAG
jgi:hypothetical protein